MDFNYPPKKLDLPTAVDGRVVFVDTEFTTLSRHRAVGRAERQLWECALIIRDPGADDIEVEWQIRPDLRRASPDSLRIGKYYRRNRLVEEPIGTGLIIVGPGFGELKPEDAYGVSRLTTADVIAAQIGRVIDGATVVANVPDADHLALDAFMTEHGQSFTPFYRLKCAETLIQGWLLGRRSAMDQYNVVDKSDLPPYPVFPWDPREMAVRAGVPLPDPALAHRALVDARWTQAIWDAAHGGRIDTIE
jgi:hypothetical protein